MFTIDYCICHYYSKIFRDNILQTLFLPGKFSKILGGTSEIFTRNFKLTGNAGNILLMKLNNPIFDISRNFRDFLDQLLGSVLTADSSIFSVINKE